MTRNCKIDLCKFLMALLVVSIHYPPLSGAPRFVLVNVIARVADPMFFALSAYLFFRKRPAGNIQALKAYLRRVGTLYLIWSLLYSPAILRQLAAEAGFAPMLLRLVRGLLFQGLYGALWFLPALMLGVTLCFVCRARFSPGQILGISLPFYLLASLATEYSALSGPLPVMQIIGKGVVTVFGWWANGLTFAFFFCALGLYFAESDSSREPFAGWKMALSVTALFAEAFLIRRFRLGTDYWAMLSLIPVSFFLMQWVLLPSPVRLPDRAVRFCILLQKTSILIFTSHVMIGGAVSRIIADATVCYCAILGITLALSLLIIALSGKIPILKKLY